MAIFEIKLINNENKAFYFFYLQFMQPNVHAHFVDKLTLRDFEVNSPDVVFMQTNHHYYSKDFGNPTLSNNSFNSDGYLISSPTLKNLNTVTDTSM